MPYPSVTLYLNDLCGSEHSPNPWGNRSNQGSWIRQYMCAKPMSAKPNLQSESRPSVLKHACLMSTWQLFTTANSGPSVLCPVGLSICPLIPTPVTALSPPAQPTIFNWSCLCLALTLSFISRTMNSIDYGASMFFSGSCGTLKFCTHWLVFGAPANSRCLFDVMITLLLRQVSALKKH